MFPLKLPAHTYGIRPREQRKKEGEKRRRTERRDWKGKEEEKEGKRRGASAAARPCGAGLMCLGRFPLAGRDWSAWLLRAVSERPLPGSAVDRAV